MSDHKHYDCVGEFCQRCKKQPAALTCACKPIEQDPIQLGHRWDNSVCPIHGPDAPRYFVDHGAIHDRVTGKHVEMKEAADLLSVEPEDVQRIAWGVVIELGAQLKNAESDLTRLSTLLAERDAEVGRLRALINTPQTDDFFAAVRNEAAHQIERWGVEHDAGKRPEDWVTLVTYLLGKASKAHFDANRDKLLHHVITLAAVALNWHRNMTGENTSMRPGVGPDYALATKAGAQ